MHLKTAGRIITAALISATTVLTSAPAFAQDAGAPKAGTPERGYILGAGGFSAGSVPAIANSVTSGTGHVQGGVRAARHLVVFGELGHISNLPSGDVPSAVTNTVASLSSTYGVDVTGSGQMPATYGLGGLKVQGTARNHIRPYGLVGVGGAHLSPTAQFAYADGTLPNADPNVAAPVPGADITGQLISAGVYTPMASSTSFMFAAGGGAEVSLNKHLMADAGYRYSRISADTPLHTQGLTVGFGVKF